MRGPPKFATPVTVIAAPSAAVSESVRNWCRRAYWTRSSLNLSLPMVEMSCADAESMRSVKSVARSVVVRPPAMFDSEKFLNRKYRAESRFAALI